MSASTQPVLTSRDEIATRTIPPMVFSQADSPLTNPLTTPEGLTPVERAIRRFSVSGNAIVTGGAGHLGLAITQGLLEHGATGIAVFDLSSTITTAQPEIKKLQNEFPQAKIITLEVNVTDESALSKATQEVKTTLGSIDLLLCFAGVLANRNSVETSAAEWRKVLEINTTGSWLCAQAVARHMIEQGQGGAMLFVGSIAGHYVLPGTPLIPYSVSKAAVLHMAKGLAAEWTRYGIRVNSISPGYINTIMNAGTAHEPTKKLCAERNPMGRMGERDELIGAIILLCSRVAGRYINGQDIKG
ncbi:NAD(P)-binding protein [Macrolepiota fuliginosa MF-IS2]|uniref:NAD(P)-binding protein n=1 Tax=Macrolepiota fuliginosa MF-IS2 TaxID=1400762 RepID=A0A9P5XEI5_9AGAR|nr:NAD(P)-binding protein [Macrolepiota fuliginosa MF-IS2]